MRSAGWRVASGAAALRIDVADDGPGVPVEQRAQIFEPFVRLHSSEAYPGTGIGLATVLVGALSITIGIAAKGQNRVHTRGFEGSAEEQTWTLEPRAEMMVPMTGGKLEIASRGGNMVLRPRHENSPMFDLFDGVITYDYNPDFKVVATLEADPREEGPCLLAGCGLVEPAAAQSVCDVVDHAEMGEQERLLEDQADGGMRRGDGFPVHPVLGFFHYHAIDMHPAAFDVLLGFLS